MKVFRMLGTKCYRLVRTGPTHDYRYSVQRLYIVGGWREIDFFWREIDFFYSEERANACFNEHINGPEVLRTDISKVY